MDSIGAWAVTTTAAVLFTWMIATATANQKTARECESLGGFYVGDVVYECKRKGGK